MKYQAYKVTNFEEFESAIKIGLYNGFGKEQFVDLMKDILRFYVRQRDMFGVKDLVVLFDHRGNNQILFNTYNDWQGHSEIEFKELTSPWEELKKLFKYA